jgi:ABC-2 type transport system permease protein
LLLVVPAAAVATLFTVALSFLVAALNVRYRDTKHLVEVLLIAGFWLNPIVYSVSLVKPHLQGWHEVVYYLNPMAGVVVSMQRALYADDVRLPNGEQVLADPGYVYYLETLALGAAISALLLWVGLRVYRRLAADFAEEL